MSEYRADERRDARIDQMQRDLVDIGKTVAKLEVQLAALTEMVRVQNAHSAMSKQSLSNTQFVAIIFVVLALASLIFSTVYYGGNR